MVVFAAVAIMGAEVARRFAVHQIAPTVSLMRFDQGKIGLDRVFEDVMTTIDFAALFTFSQRRAVAGRRKNRAQTGAGGLDSRREITLRDQFELHFAATIKIVKNL
ncbi:Uncharacterised protein [Raoultella planticola]|uniref:Uncharacterized protein n=1 Tax=Raoultella planticola TaxID=575 RepID=A0A485AAN1_RAOPL|nr:Uncharacterised protein [Raoultella planticola]